MKPLIVTRALTVVFFVLLGVSALYSAPNPQKPDESNGSDIQAAVAEDSLQSEKEQLGKDLFFDTSLSNPAGMSCSTCHDPTVSFTYPESETNEKFGPVPGAIPDRSGFRIPPSISYAYLLPQGPPYFNTNVSSYVGGLFWDGRAANLQAQATMPFLNPNEMNDLVHNVGSPAMVVHNIHEAPYAPLFREVYGETIFEDTTEAYKDMADAITAYEKTPIFAPFSSKYDMWLQGKATLTADELDGLRLVTGSWTGRRGGAPYYKIIDGKRVFRDALCSLCHGIPNDPKKGPDLWTNTCYANIGVPRNTNNPYYKLTDEVTDPAGYNPLGIDFVDLGLGDYLYPALGLPVGNIGPGSNGRGDYLQINGTFKAPSLRNVAKVPYPGFVRAYMHNGVFKSLKEVVHFYNTRNLTTVPGEVIDFTRPDPYAGLLGTPLWPEPEYPSPVTLQNPTGLPGDNHFTPPGSIVANVGGESSSPAQVGNLGLTDDEENHIVEFLETLSDQ